MKRSLTSIVAALAITAQPTHCQAVVPPAQKDGVTVNFSRLAQNDLQFSYTFITRKAGFEFSRCLHGSIDGQVATVQYTRPPFITYTASDSTSFTCEHTPDYLGPGHSHPQKNYDTCMPSAIDLVTFLEDKRSRMMAVFCDENRYLTILRPAMDDSALAYVRSLPRRAGVKVTP